LAAATFVGAIFGTAGAARAANKATYYLSLGDSRASQDGGVKHNYPDQLFKLVRGEFTQLRLVKLACGGENTDTMINGGICTYLRALSSPRPWHFSWPTRAYGPSFAPSEMSHPNSAGYGEIAAAFEAVLPT
jgi:hypothetical protein